MEVGLLGMGFVEFFGVMEEMEWFFNLVFGGSLIGIGGLVW